MKVANEEKWKKVGYAKLCMNLVYYQLKQNNLYHNFMCTIYIIPIP